MGLNGRPRGDGFERLKNILRNSWLFPRHIGFVYVRQAIYGAKGHLSGRLLDVGCGLRQFEDLLADRVTGYVGLDWPVLAERARPDVIGDALNLPISSKSVDSVLATELMEHLPDPGRFLSEVARVLRNGGSLVLSVPFVEALHEEPRDYYRFTPYSLRLLLERGGFVVERIWRKGGWWSVVLGSVVCQSLYEWANPADNTGRRSYGIVAAAILPVCAAAQLLAYGLDRFFGGSRYTLGFTVLATLRGRI